MDRTGQKLGNYEIQRQIGQGGFAEVYLGQHLFLKRPGAIKVMQAQFDPSTFAQFQAEAQVIANLQHPNIVPVLEFGLAEKDHAPFLVMPYLPQGSLRQRHPRGSHIALPVALEYLKQVAAALQYAHMNKVIHRDIKPENMLLGDAGQVLLSDFGIALVLQSSHYQNSRDIVGTIAYMSPEQLRGRVTFPSDQYALAITFYEWLTGAPPFQGSFAEVGGQHLHQPSPSLLGRIPSVPPGVDQVIQKALAKDPRQRFACVLDFARALEIAAGGNDPTGLIRSSFAVNPDEPTVPAQQSLVEPPTDLMQSTNDLGAGGLSLTDGIPRSGTATRDQVNSGAIPGMPMPVGSPSGVQQSIPPDPNAVSILYPPPPPSSSYPPFQNQNQSGIYPPGLQSNFNSGHFSSGGPPFMTPPLQPAGGTFGQQPAKPKKFNGIALISILVLVLLLLGTGAWGYLHFFASTASPGVNQNPQSGPTQQPGATAVIQPTPTPEIVATPSPDSTNVPGINPTPGSGASPTPSGPVTSYSAPQPGPGCDLNGGTWVPSPQGAFRSIQCGTTVTMDANQVRGYLNLQLPGNRPYASTNRIEVSGTIGSYYNDTCLGLAESDANTGYMVEFCRSGKWAIASISGSGSIIKTLASNITATRDNMTISLTLKGSTLTFAVDTESHPITITSFQPVKVAITAFGNSDETISFNNFSYITQF